MTLQARQPPSCKREPWQTKLLSFKAHAPSSGNTEERLIFFCLVILLPAVYDALFLLISFVTIKFYPLSSSELKHLALCKCQPCCIFVVCFLIQATLKSAVKGPSGLAHPSWASNQFAPEPQTSSLFCGNSNASLTPPTVELTQTRHGPFLAPTKASSRPAQRILGQIMSLVSHHHGLCQYMLKCIDFLIWL